MKIWITGSAGFLGQRLARELSARGHEVVGISRRASSFEGRAVSLDLSSDGARARLEELAGEGGPPQAVVHAASKQPGSRDVSEYVRANVLATANLLDALTGTPPRLFLYTSTLSVYDRPHLLPVKETERAGGALPYAATKRWGEILVRDFEDRAQIITLRLPSLYGAGQADSFIDGLARRAARDEPLELFSRGQLIRDALHVSEIVKAIAACLERPPEPRFCLMNLGGGRAIATAEYARALVLALGSASAVVPVERPAAQFDLYADIALARRLIGFEPKTLEDSMREYVDELRA